MRRSEHPPSGALLMTSRTAVRYLPVPGDRHAPGLARAAPAGPSLTLRVRVRHGLRHAPRRGCASLRRGRRVRRRPRSRDRGNEPTGPGQLPRTPAPPRGPASPVTRAGVEQDPVCPVNERLDIAVPEQPAHMALALTNDMAQVSGVKHGVVRVLPDRGSGAGTDGAPPN